MTAQSAPNVVREDVGSPDDKERQEDDEERSVVTNLGPSPSAQGDQVAEQSRWIDGSKERDAHTDEHVIALKQEWAKNNARNA